MPETDAPTGGRAGTQRSEGLLVDPTDGADAPGAMEANTGIASLSAGPTVSLTHLQPGRCGWVRTVSAVSADVERLKVMGVCAGRKVRLVRRGDPLILCIWGTRVGVSRRLADQVMVHPCPGPEQNGDGCRDEDAGCGGSRTSANTRSKELVQR